MLLYKYKNVVFFIIQTWAEKIGFTITHNLEDFKKPEFKIKIILVHKPHKPVDNVEMPLITDIMGKKQFLNII